MNPKEIDVEIQKLQSFKEKYPTKKLDEKSKTINPKEKHKLNQRM